MTRWAVMMRQSMYSDWSPVSIWDDMDEADYHMHTLIALGYASVVQRHE